MSLDLGKIGGIFRIQLFHKTLKNFVNPVYFRFK